MGAPRGGMSIGQMPSLRTRQIGEPGPPCSMMEKAFSPMRVLLLAFAIVVAFYGPAGAQTVSRAPTPFDQLFLRNEATGSAYELAIAQLAQRRAVREDVRTYAAQLVNDHEAYNGALRELAKQKGISLPSNMTARSIALRDSLALHRGMAFDRAFIREARRINDEDVRSFRREASRTTDPEISAFVARFLMVDEEHAKGAAALSVIKVAQGLPVIRPPAVGSNMPVIKPPAGGTAMPVIAPPPTSR